MLLTKRQIKTAGLIACKVGEGGHGRKVSQVEGAKTEWTGGEKKPGELGFRFWYHELIGQIAEC